MWVLAPTGEILSFASPKESFQRKGDPVAAWILRCYENLPWFAPYGPAFGCSNLLQANLSLSAGAARRGLLPLWQRASSMKRPFGLIPPKAPVLGAANGIFRKEHLYLV